MFILWNNAGWHWAIACRNCEFQWTIIWYNYEIRTNLFLIISRLSQVLVFILALLFQYISNVDTALPLLTIFCVFSLSTVVLKFTVHNIFICSNFSQHIYYQISIFYCLNSIKILNVLYSDYFLHLLLLQHGDIESNPRSKKEQIKYLSYCHWNINSLLAQKVCIISQIEACNSLYNYDFICILETYLKSLILEGGFQLNGYHRLWSFLAKL